MQVHEEVELKWCLDAAGHERCRLELSRMLEPGRVAEQSNRFFDSRDFRLRQAGMSLRLRRENERCLLTCKRRRRSGADGLHIHQEQEMLVNAACWSHLQGADPARWLPVPAAASEALAGQGLLALGGFDNHRLRFERSGEQIALDDTRFPDGSEDWELEVETSDPEGARMWWEQRLASWGIAIIPQTETKLLRFWNRCIRG